MAFRFSPTHLRYARQGRYRDVPYLDRYYNSAMDRFVKKGGSATNRDLYRSTYAHGTLTPPKGYFFDVAKGDLVPTRKIDKKREVLHDGLLYRGQHLMQELLPRSARAPVAAAKEGFYTIEAAIYGRRHPSREEAKRANKPVRNLSVFGRPVRRVGSHGTNDALMGGEQVILRELMHISLTNVSSDEFARFQRPPQENRLYIFNTDDCNHFLHLCVKNGISIPYSAIQVVKITGVSVGREGGRVSELGEAM